MALATKTGQVVYLQKGEPGQDGQDGQKGERGPSIRGPRRWEEVDNGSAFQSGQEGEAFIDTVLYQENVYRCIRSHTKSSTWVSSYWQVGNEFKFVATDLLMAAYALIKNLGVTSVEITGDEGFILMKNSADETVLEARDGNVNIKGNLTAGTVGAFTIDKGISNTDDNTEGYIRIERSGGRFWQVNQYDAGFFMQIRNDGESSVGLRADNYGTGAAIEAVCNQGGEEGYAIRAYGNVAMLARESEGTEVHGLHLNCRRITAGGTLNKNDDIIWYGETTDITLHLDNFEAGKVLWFKRTGAGAIILAGRFIEPGTGDVVTNYYMDTASMMAVKMPDGNYGYWALFYCG